jgi:polyisoprenyl-phosphate glycosyltransferase
MPHRFVILTPVLDDWLPFSCLIEAILKRYSTENGIFEVVVVDDGSTDPCDLTSLPHLKTHACIESISVIRLALNLGHQRAIAIGLASLSERTDIDACIVMDSDGEDRPDDIGALIGVWRAHPDHVIVAGRAERSEAPTFKMGYLVYKARFRVLVGREMAFGNFCLLPASAVRRLVHMPELWNNLPAAIIRSRVRRLSVQTKRGTRYAGSSKMNLTSLVMHGLSAMSVYTDVIFVRVLLAGACISGLTVSAMLIVVVIRVVTALAIPGWATTIMGSLVVILVQALILMIVTTLVLLANRSMRQLVPIIDTKAFVAAKQTIMRRQQEHQASSTR